VTRVLVLLAVLAAIGGVALVYARATRRDAERGGDGLPPLPGALLAGPTTWVIFTTPYCASCAAVEAELHRAFPDDAVVTVDATIDVELADRYHVRRAPTVLRADARGAVTERLVGADAVRGLTVAA
jgi:hypothetical protein